MNADARGGLAEVQTMLRIADTSVITAMMRKPSLRSEQRSGNTS